LIFLDTNVVSETLRTSPDAAVISWLVRHDAELALPTVTIAEITFGARKIRLDQGVARLEEGLSEWRRRYADRIFGLTEDAALAYGDIMGDASRRGAGMSSPDGMIAAIARRPARNPQSERLPYYQPRADLPVGFLARSSPSALRAGSA
jgi:predicted nucleic acid-binding protein